MTPNPKPLTQWAIVTPRGRILEFTINSIKQGSWSDAVHGLDALWKLWCEDSIEKVVKIAKSKGYRCVRVRVEVVDDDN